MAQKEIIKIISPSGDDRLRLKIETEKGKVVNMIVQYAAILILAQKLSGRSCGSRFQLEIDHVSKGFELISMVPDKKRGGCLFR